MKAFTISLIILTLILLGIIYLASTEMSDRNRVLQSEVDGLRIETKKEKDSLNQVLKVTKDSLSIAFNTIKIANLEKVWAHEASQKEIKKLRAVVHVVYENDSLRINALKELYKTF